MSNQEQVEDVQRCPRRDENPQADYMCPLPDEWWENSWVLDLDKLQHEQATLAAGGTCWRWDWMPRTCSYCGSLHPEDVLKLLAEGWEHEKATGKNYKGYLHPPGYHDHCQRVLGAIGDEAAEQKVFAESKFWSPVPCTKLYIMHFSKEQIGQLNAAIQQ